MEPGGHETLFPLDAELNLPPERYSFGIRRRAAEEATRGAYDDVVKILGTEASAAVAKRQVEEVVRRAVQDFDSFYLERRLAWPTETGASRHILVLTFDGKGVPMRRADLRPATQAAAARRQRKLATRLTKGEKRHVKYSRMMGRWEMFEQHNHQRGTHPRSQTPVLCRNLRMPICVSPERA
jgi:hypothetical protein